MVVSSKHSCTMLFFSNEYSVTLAKGDLEQRDRRRLKTSKYAAHTDQADGGGWAVLPDPTNVFKSSRSEHLIPSEALIVSLSLCLTSFSGWKLNLQLRSSAAFKGLFILVILSITSDNFPVFEERCMTLPPPCFTMDGFFSSD